MKKRYLFVVIAILAAGLVFTGCDLINGAGGADNGKDNNGGGGTQEPYDNLEITGEDSNGNAIKTIFSTTRKLSRGTVMTPQSDDSYKILSGATEISNGQIKVSGSLVTFTPANGNSPFEAVLVNNSNNHILNFPSGIPTSSGPPITYKKSESVIDPQFTAAGDLDETVTPLRVTMAADSGGSPSYQWYKGAAGDSYAGGTPISGATSESYTPPTATPGTFYYYVYITNASGGFLKSKIATVVVGGSSSANEITVGGSNGIRIDVLKDVINYMLTSNKNPKMDYTVRFAVDPKSILVISPANYPGDGKVTIKSDAPLSRGIHITRNNIELNGLRIMITNPDNAPKYEDGNPCAVLISNRYGAYTGNPNTKTPNGYYNPVTDYEKYIAFAKEKESINKVAIVGCSINIVSEADVIMGICVDPSTAGRTAENRVKITGAEVYVENRTSNKDAQCFFGNYADFIDNTFTLTTTSTNNGVLFISFILGLKADTVSFKDNKFINNSASYIARVDVNIASHDSWTDGTEEKFEQIPGNFGKSNHKFDGFTSKYKTLINDLFKIPNFEKKYVLLFDWKEDWSEYEYNYALYRKEGDKYEVNYVNSGAYVGWH